MESPLQYEDKMADLIPAAAIGPPCVKEEPPCWGMKGPTHITTSSNQPPHCLSAQMKQEKPCPEEEGAPSRLEIPTNEAQCPRPRVKEELFPCLGGGPPPLTTSIKEEESPEYKAGNRSPADDQHAGYVHCPSPEEQKPHLDAPRPLSRVTAPPLPDDGESHSKVTAPPTQNTSVYIKEELSEGDLGGIEYTTVHIKEEVKSCDEDDGAHGDIWNWRSAGAVIGCSAVGGGEESGDEDKRTIGDIWHEFSCGEVTVHSAVGGGEESGDEDRRTVGHRRSSGAVTRHTAVGGVGKSDDDTGPLKVIWRKSSSGAVTRRSAMGIGEESDQLTVHNKEEGESSASEEDYEEVVPESGHPATRDHTYMVTRGEKRMRAPCNTRRLHKTLSCGECGKIFFGKSALRIHQRLHRGKVVYACAVCGKKFYRKSACEKHQEAGHSLERSFECPKCERCFSSKLGVTLHQRIHRRQAAFTCQQCTESFTCHTALLQHQRLHYTPRRLRCSKCGILCQNKSDLINHESTHPVTQAFACSECGQRFPSKAQLSAHWKVHTVISVFSWRKVNVNHAHPPRETEPNIEGGE